MKLRSIRILLLSAAITGPAFAQSPRTFVSAANGSDTNPCSRPLPCRNFAAAATATLANGEVIALDSGGYGPVVISQSISLAAPAGVYAGVTGFSGDTCDISGAVTDTITLRGLFFNGLGASNGVFVSSGNLIVDSCSFSNFTVDGIRALSGGQVTVRRTTARGNANNGITIAGTVTGPTIAHGTIIECTATNNYVGLYPGNYSRVAIVDSISSLNDGYGVYACCNDTKTWITRSTASNDVLYGIGAGPSSEIYLGFCTITANGTGLFETGGGTIFSMQNNLVRANTLDLNPAPTPFAPQ